VASRRFLNKDLLMPFSDVLQRFVKDSPFCVMARGLLESAFAPAKMDALFEDHAEAQETRKLLFSSCVEVMSWVANTLDL